MSVCKVFADPLSLAPRIEELKRCGQTIVFANGCFELLHVGHVRYLIAAKEFGDVLIVAVNTDESMSVIKPERTPINPDRERMEIIAAFEAVDFVVPLRETTPHGLIELFRPHVHTKGTDYTLDRIPERTLVESYGGRVVIVGDAKRHSTTDMLRAIRH